MSFADAQRQHCSPVFVTSLDDRRTLHELSHVPYSRNGSDGHSEQWLQALVAEFPKLLPIGEIEPGFGELKAICVELPTSAGPVDNLFLTPEGNIVLVECKLWRNPQVRREVVAQIMDYAQAMARWGYDDLEAAAKRADPSIGSLHAQVGSKLDEAAFVDAVSRNLTLGRVLLVILGDGIRSGVEQLTSMLQAHAGFHFTLALVEMPVFRIDNEGFIVVPRILAQTVTIERGIVTVNGDLGGFRIESPTGVIARSSSAKRRSISIEQGLEALRNNVPVACQRLEQFLSCIGERKIVLEPATKSLVIRWYSPDDSAFSLGIITLDGNFDTYNVGWGLKEIDRLEIAHNYLKDIAMLVGAKIRESEKPENWNIRNPDGKPVPAAMVLANPEALLQSIDRYTNALNRATGTPLPAPVNPGCPPRMAPGRPLL